MRIPYLKWALAIVVAVLMPQWLFTHLSRDIFQRLDLQAVNRIPTALITEKQSENPLSEQELAIPLERKAGIWVVSVLINDFYEAELIIDSGATITTLSEDFAFELGLHRQPSSPTIPIETVNGTTRAWLATIRSLAIGAIHVPHLSVAIVELSNLTQHGIDGLLGGDILKTYTWRIDSRHHRLILSPP
ncbi:MAG: hypothetical protein D6690_05675 [Nitrospirae bacterium]|nr:MAG: hypothetical protein D6690_05675 [Nitrospirota bacterium]